MKAVSEMKRINDSLARRLAYNSRMDKLSWSRSLEVEAEARRQQDEVQRQQDEVQRQQDEQFRLETVRMQQEADRKVQIALEIEAEMKGKLAIAFRRLLASGYREDEVVALLGIDPNEPKL